MTSSEALPAGKSTIRVRFKYDCGSMAKGGAVKMFVNDKQVADGRVDETIFVHFLRRRDLRHRARHRLTSQ